MDRFPIVITLGAGLLGWIAGEMLVTDVVVKPWLETAPWWLHYACAAAGALFVVGLGTWRTRRAGPISTAIREIPLAPSADGKA